MKNFQTQKEFINVEVIGIASIEDHRNHSTLYNLHLKKDNDEVMLIGYRTKDEVTEAKLSLTQPGHIISFAIETERDMPSFHNETGQIEVIANLCNLKLPRNCRSSGNLF